jgi:VanZ family protein
MQLLISFILRILPLAYMVLIWYLSSNPSDAVVTFSSNANYDTFIKESLHLVEFGILYVLWVIAFLSRGDLTRKQNLTAVAIAMIYGLLDEFHQYFVPSRSATVIDLTKDWIGVGVAWLIITKTGMLMSMKYILNKHSRGL